MADDNGPGYKVGYRKPPIHSRFQKGQSGNRRGRRRSTLNHRTVLERTLLKPITVTEGGKPKKMIPLEIVIRQLINKAVKGDVRAAQWVARLGQQLAEASESGQSIEIIISPDESKY